MFKILFTSKSSSTHHKIVLDSLRLLNYDELGDDWKNLFLKYYKDLLDGARAPDKQFKDFKNHVLHVNDNYWGGAPTKAREWYTKLVTDLKSENWKDATFSLGVLSHYVADPHHPLHTGQVEGEGRVHKWFEWGVIKRYEEIQTLIEDDLGGYPEVTIPNTKTWLEDIIKEGAIIANSYYEDVLDHYKVEVGKKNPASGIDEPLLRVTAMILGRTVSTLTQVLERAIREAQITPPKYDLTFKSFILSLQIPIFWITRKLEDRKMIKQLKELETEFQEKGRVDEKLAEDDKFIRRAYAKEIRKINLEQLNQLPVKQTGTKYRAAQIKPKKAKPKLYTTKPTPNSKIISEFQRRIKTKKTKLTTTTSQEPIPQKPTPQKPKNEKLEKKEPVKKEPKREEPMEKQKPLRYYVHLNDDIQEAPEIGKRTAEKLKSIGIMTVKDLLEKTSEEIAHALKHSRITARDVERWKVETKLMLTIPFLRGYEAKLLYLAGYVNAESIQQANPEELYSKISEILKNKAGERALRSSKPPTKDKVKNWIEHARQGQKRNQ